MITNYTGVSGSRTSYLIARQLTETNRALVVVSNGRAAARLAEDLAFFLPAAQIVVMPESDDIQVLYEARDRSSQVQRMKGIQALCGGAFDLSGVSAIKGAVQREARDQNSAGQNKTGQSNGAGLDPAMRNGSNGSSGAYEPGHLNSNGAGAAVVIAPVSAAVRLTVTPARYLSSVMQLSMGDQLEPAELRELLVAAGYNHAAVTESPGEFTSRGGIVDVFPPALSFPVRIEFFGDEIDSIRYYDPDTQRSLENAPKITIGPAAEFIPTGAEKREALNRIRREYDRRIRSARSQYADKKVADGRIGRLEEHKSRVTDLFEEQSNIQIYSDFLEYFDVEKSRLWDYLNMPESGGPSASALTMSKTPISTSETDALAMSKTPISTSGTGTLTKAKTSSSNTGLVIIRDPARVEEELPESVSKEDFRSIYNCTNVAVYTPFPERIAGIDRLDRIINVRSRQIAPFNGQIDLFAAETAKLADSGYSITIVSSSEERSERIREYLDIAEVEGNITYRSGNLSAGFIMEDDRTCYISEQDIFPENRNRPRRTSRSGSGAKSRSRKKSADMIQFSDLHKGDYVVHEVHGIGRFEGIRTMTADGMTRDYLVIRYAGSDMLYIPTEQLDIIQKYIGNSGNAPMLSRLSGGNWRRTRERARKAVLEIAEDLVRLYAERQAAGGYAFSEDTVWQAEFEDDFPFVETDDQLRATEEIKEDMQRPLPMDRLLCGDVGYGKTEVAARAVFKCISEGKQAAILAPTTLLVNQHYHNLKERFENFPFEIEELSRFRTAAEQKKITRALKNGNIDLIIGTHRLLSEDVRFKDLGLLVIDEEQRFGVRHKEKIKELRKNIDVLTLSATPIPRTLNMSLTGIKDISTIDEPPGDRLPVSTYVTPYEEDIMRNAIERELARGGQVFVVNNRITGLNQIRETIQRLVPDAITAIGHGRMSEETLENTMLDFVEGRINVLIATTIIENGIDIPNANTMIILNADRFGLAQLYQLRGRVGRSHRLAYAYLMYQPDKVLTEIARKRLTAIREFTEFGAGFKVAMRDLELRGAGNMLGEAQSGHIESIGYELYCKEIDRAVRKLKGETVTEQRSDIKIELETQASIPSAYIGDETLRLQAYKKIANITGQEDAEDLADELLDRYGEVPEETLNLLKVAEIRAHAEMTGAVNIARRDKRFIIRFAQVNRFNAYAAVMAKAEFGDQLTIMSGRVTSLGLYTGRNIDLNKLLSLMRTIRNAAETAEKAQG